MGKTKKDMNASRAAGRRKQTTETATSFPDFPVFFSNFRMGLNESNDSSISNSSEEFLSTSLLSLSSSQIFTGPFSSLDLICLPTWYDSYSFIREANFRFFTHWCTFIRSSLFSLFRTGPCFSIRDIHTGNSRENRLGWLHTRHRAVNQEVSFFFQRKRKTTISPPIFSPFQKFASEIRGYSSTTTLTQKSKSEENCRSEGIR